MPKAIWNETVIADSDQTELVENNHYFPVDSLKSSFFRESATTSVCGWKGTANYYDIVIGGDVHTDAAWYYAEPKPQAANIKGYVAFWKGVQIVN